jgi:hypothetical protein
MKTNILVYQVQESELITELNTFQIIGLLQNLRGFMEILEENVFLICMLSLKSCNDSKSRYDC